MTEPVRGLIRCMGGGHCRHLPGTCTATRDQRPATKPATSPVPAVDPADVAALVRPESGEPPAAVGDDLRAALAAERGYWQRVADTARAEADEATQRAHTARDRAASARMRVTAVDELLGVWDETDTSLRGA